MATTDRAVPEVPELPELPETRTATAPARPRGPALRRAARAAWPAAFAVGGLVLLAAYYGQARTSGVNSDGASNALQAWDMLHGNPLLRGWTVTDVSFYTIQLPQLMLAEQVSGLSAGVLHLTAALDYTLLVLVAALLAKGRAAGREGAIRVLLAAGIMLAPPLGATTTVLLHDPDHTATQIVLLAIWLILDRARPRWQVAAGVSAMLAWAQVSDAMAAYEGALPLVIVCGIRLYRRRAAPTAEREGAGRSELWLAAGAAASVVAAAVAQWLIRLAGGFITLPPDTTVTPVRLLCRSAALTVRDVLTLFGAGLSGMRPGLHAMIPLAHLAGVILAGWAVASALRWFGGSELAVQLAAVAVVLLLAAYVFRYERNSGPHELVGVLAASAVLAGRLLARPLLSGPLGRGRVLRALCALVFACLAGLLAHDAVQPPPARDANRQLAAWLRAHDLRYGLAAYWNADSVTFDSRDQVQLRPVYRYPVDHLQGINRASDAAWFSPRGHNASFLVVPSAGLGCLGGTPRQWRATARRQFGAPAASYRVGPFLVLTWHANLLARLGEAKPRNPC